MKTGTSHFTDKPAAIHYYQDYGYDCVYAAVREKLDSGEIHLGEPDYNHDTQRLSLIDDGLRYAIEDK